MKKSNIIILILAIAVILGIAISRDNKNASSPRNLEEAPVFSLEDYKGNIVSLSEFTGKGGRSKCVGKLVSFLCR